MLDEDTINEERQKVREAWGEKKPKIPTLYISLFKRQVKQTI